MKQAECVFGICVWLSMLDPPVNVGKGRSMDPLAETARRFCEAHGIPGLGELELDELVKHLHGPTEEKEEKHADSR